jgi:APA family basic amino acid/polyamine antiporter
VVDKQTAKVIAEVAEDGTIIAVDDEGKAVEEKAGRFSEPELFVTPEGEVIAAEKIWATDLSTKWLEDPVMGIVRDEERGLASELPTLSKILAVWVGILAATILLIATNAGILGISRLTFSMGKYKQLPPRFAKLQPRFKTPYMAILFAGAVAAVLILPGRVDLLADLYSFGAMIGFTSAHLSVIMLRIKEPDLHRPFKAPLNFRIRGVELPLTAIIGGLATFSVWVIVVVTHTAGRYVGFTWLAIGLAIYIWYRRSHKLPLVKTIEMEEPVTLQYPDVEYDNILVPVIGNTISREAMVMACELANEEDSSIYALHVIEVPMSRPLEKILPEESELAGTLLAEAKEVAEEFGVKLFPKIVPGRNVGRVIVDEAIDKKSQIVMIGTERKRRTGDRFFGHTVEYVLKKAPCKVLVVSSEKAS